MASSDIVWNVQTRDIEFATDGDFLTTDNASVQNGGILLEARCMNILFPAAGIGFNSQVLGGNTSQAAFQLNRWVSQVRADGGVANWKRNTNPPNINFDFSADVNYQQ